MGDEYIESLLEAPYKNASGEEGKEEKHSTKNPKNSRKEKRHSSGDRSRESRSQEKKVKRSRSRERRRHSSRSRHKRSRSPRRSGHGSSRRRRSRSNASSSGSGPRGVHRERRHHHRSRYSGGGRSRRSTERENGKAQSPKVVSSLPHLTPEERDQRTILLMQLASSVTERDLYEKFSSVGKIRDIRLIMDSRSRKHKGLAYIEFVDPEPVYKALAMNGQKLKDRPIVVQHSHAEKNRCASASAPPSLQKNNAGPMKLYVGSLHVNINEDMLNGIFEPFGTINFITLVRDENGKSRGYGYIEFKDIEDAKRSQEQLNGFELAGKPLQVTFASNLDSLGLNPDSMLSSTSNLDTDIIDRTGVNLGAIGRAHLMAKLAQGAGMSIVPAKIPTSAPEAEKKVHTNTVAPPIASSCFLLTNMFNPLEESNSNWEKEIYDDVMTEANKYGSVIHMFIDKTSASGNVYVKSSSIMAAQQTVTSLHGRYFAGKIISAAYIPMATYHQLFPDSVNPAPTINI